MKSKWTLFKVLAILVLILMIPGLNLRMSEAKLFFKRLYLKDPIQPGVNYHYQVAIASVFQQEAPYLKEWIEFHRLMGVEHFYLYNNLSTDNFNEVLAPYITSGLVDLIEWPYVPKTLEDWNGIQCRAFQHALKQAKGHTKWLALIDTDEFLVPHNKNLQDFLTDYEPYGGVAVNWQMFGTSDVKKIPEDKLLIEMLTHKAMSECRSNYHVKSIVRPEAVASCYNPHFVVYKFGYFHVNPNKMRFEGPQSTEICTDKIQLNHYWSRDEHYYYTVKLARQTAWGLGFNSVNQKVAQELNAVEDRSLAYIVPALREAVGLDKNLSIAQEN